MADKILIVEDDSQILELLSVRLKAAGYQIITSTDAMSGVQSAHRFLPNLILLDIKMPAGGGITVLDSLKASDHTRNIPILVMTGFSNDGMKAKLLQHGIKTYIQKPFKPEELLEAVAKILPTSAA